MHATAVQIDRGAPDPLHTVEAQLAGIGLLAHGGSRFEILGQSDPA
jgi:hypothetical protein